MGSEIVERLTEQVAHVRLGLSVRKPNLVGATRALCDISDEAAARITALEAMCEKMAEELPFAIAKALYGPDFDPFQNPEAFDFCETVARDALAQYREADNA